MVNLGSVAALHVVARRTTVAAMPSATRFSSRFRRLALVACATGLGFATTGSWSAGADAPRSRYFLGVSNVAGSRNFGVTAAAYSPSGGRQHVPLTVKLVRRGSVVATSAYIAYGVAIREVPRVGDVMRFESPPGKLVANVVYDGTPTIVPRVCAGATAASGRLHDVTTKVTSVREAGRQFGKVVRTPAGLWRAVSQRRMSPKAHIRVAEAGRILAGDEVISYMSEYQRRVGKCARGVTPDQRLK
jgi:hypothetical protein